MRDVFLWSREVLWGRTALCRALPTARVSAGQRDRYHQVLCLGCPPGSLDIQNFVGWPRHRRGRLDIMRTISILGGLRAWRSWQRFARQDVGGHRDQEERYHGMISWPMLFGCLESVRLPARQKNRTLYSDGRQDYTPGIRSMSGRKFLINPQQDTCSGYYAGKNS